MMALFKIALSAAIVFSLFFVGLACGEPDMQEGMWEMTMKTEMPGMPMEMPPMKFNQCLTKKDMVPQKKEKNEDCKMVNTKIDGNTVTWVMQCRLKDGTMDSTGKITYKGNGFDGDIKAIMNTKDTDKMEIIQHMTGRRIGDCK
ncbi:MAG TPA: DUF3617 family protein [Thermodesulfovibrionales bacterium]|nr:DUF3617 family protein [Thermodesulfovibrionales bacterium]